MPDSKARDECVGTLLVHQQDLLDLSGSKSKSTGGVTREAVGTLILPQSDMKVLSSHEIQGAGVAANAAESTDEPKVTLIRRITNTMTGPPPGDDESDLWAD